MTRYNYKRLGNFIRRYRVPLWVAKRMYRDPKNTMSYRREYWAEIYRNRRIAKAKAKFERQREAEIKNQEARELWQRKMEAVHRRIRGNYIKALKRRIEIEEDPEIAERLKKRYTVLSLDIDQGGTAFRDGFMYTYNPDTKILTKEPVD